MNHPFRVALVHYHLRGGGVSRVAEHIDEAIRRNNGSLAVFVGEAPPANTHFADSARVIPALTYGTTLAEYDATAVCRDLRAQAADALGGSPDLWHIHNHSLGKNAVLPAVVRCLADAGEKLLLQIHDFAEDGRPENYRFLLDALGDGDAAVLAERLYPDAPQVYYATLNRRDAAFLQDAGAPPEQVHSLPNAVDLGPGSDAPPAPPGGDGKRAIIYPTRAIRRKNLGELLLWATLAGEDEQFLVTLAPKNPAARPVYERWVAFAREHSLPVIFEAGRKTSLSFPDLLRSAHALATTSVAEGFGLAFLEAWLADRPLYGRALPEISGEFSEQGVDLDALYTRLDVPLDWVGEDAFARAVETGLRGAWEAYGRAVTKDAVDDAIGAAVSGDRIDFGRLDEPLQERVLDRLGQDAAASAALIHPARLDANTVPSAAVENNRRLVRERFSLDQYARRLASLYETLREADPGPVRALCAERLLDRFMAPDRFFLLRT